MQKFSSHTESLYSHCNYVLSSWYVMPNAAEIKAGLMVMLCVWKVKQCQGQMLTVREINAPPFIWPDNRRCTTLILSLLILLLVIWPSIVVPPTRQVLSYIACNDLSNSTTETFPQVMSCLWVGGTLAQCSQFPVRKYCQSDHCSKPKGKTTWWPKCQSLTSQGYYTYMTRSPITFNGTQTKGMGEALAETS